MSEVGEMWGAFARPFLNIQKIFPTKQKYVARMVDACRAEPNIKRAIVFGSAITAGCNPWSDIDIYFEMDKEPRNYPTIGSHKQAFDKWDNFSVSEALRQEIMEKGVVVYERGGNSAGHSGA